MAQTEDTTKSLRTALSEAVPHGVACRFNYLHSPPKECDPLFSPPPGQEPEKTRLASHFLGVSAPATPVEASTTPDSALLLLGIEVLVYMTKTLTTIFVSKADSTGHASRSARVPVKNVCTAFLRWLVGSERQKHPHRQMVISLFARAQAQYLFPGSSEHGGKHTLDDRQLIKWWARVLDPLIVEAEAQRTADSEAPHYQGYVTVPGYDKTEVRSFFPPSTPTTVGRWKAGDPLRELAAARGVAITMPRTLLPRFPDDPKARYMQDLDDEVGLVEVTASTASPAKRRNGQWKNIHDLDRFWEAMEFRQECSSGRVVGFLWLVVTTEESVSAGTDAEDAEDLSSRKAFDAKKKFARRRPGARVKPQLKGAGKRKTRKRLTGPIVVRRPRPKGISTSIQRPADLNEAVNGVAVSAEGYDQVMHTLLRLDFGKESISIHSTQKWTEEIASVCGMPKRSWGVEVIGTANYLPARPDASASVNAPVNDLGGMVRKKRKTTDGETVHTASDGVDSAINNLGVGLIRKKPKVTAP